MLDNKYYGMYRASVVDSEDPEGLGRVKLVVPQVSGMATTDWAWPVGGNITQSKWPYGTFLTLADQTIAVNTPTVLTNWVEEDVNRTYLAGTSIYVEETGDYFLQLSAVITKKTAASGTADVWIRKNGVDLANSNTRVKLSGSNAETVLAAALILDLDAGDHIQMVASASSANTVINYIPAEVGPAIPGIIATINLTGKWKPQPGTGVWAMFEGGDQNFPLWVGGF